MRNLIERLEEASQPQDKEAENLLKELDAWLDERPDHQNKFIKSLRDQLSSKGSLSVKQMKAARKIIAGEPQETAKRKEAMKSLSDVLSKAHKE